MSRVLLLSPRADEIETQLRPWLPADVELLVAAEPEAVPDRALDADVAFGAPDQLAELLPRLPSLRWLQSTWAGVTPLIAQPRRDFILTNARGIFGAAMSEYVLGWVLALERSILRHAAARRWDPQLDRGLGQLRLGVAGIGSIGAEVVRRAAPFFCETVGLNSDGRAVPGCARVYSSRQIGDFAAGLDVLVMLLPATTATDGLVNAEVLAALADGAILINAGRANSLVLSDTLRALESGRLSAVVLDVFEEEPLADDDPLWALPGLYITSHTAAPTETPAIVRLFLENLARLRNGKTLIGRIDFERGY
jgi:phosphoglycerate dehydrogenase-like enzyme